MKTPHEKLIGLYESFYGEFAIDKSELEMIVNILEQLIDMAEKQKDHTHRLN